MVSLPAISTTYGETMRPRPHRITQDHYKQHYKGNPMNTTLKILIGTPVIIVAAIGFSAICLGAWIFSPRETRKAPEC